MMQIERPTPIYDALLLLADASEKKIILEGGEKERLYGRLLYGDGHDGGPRARAAYNAISDVVERLTQNRSLKITGVKVGGSKLKRTKIDPSLVRAGILSWRPSGDFTSQLLIDLNEEEPVRFIEVQVEPVADSLVAEDTRLEGPSKLSGAERSDDSARLKRMSEIVEQGKRIHTAARMVAAEMKDSHTVEKSLAARLSRKYKKRMK